jgi:hypothetical protein
MHHIWDISVNRSDGMMKALIAAFLLAAPLMASDKPNCNKSYCSGTTYYTNGYAVCAGQDCWCEYTQVPESANCPKVETTGDPRPRPSKGGDYSEFFE